MPSTVTGGNCSGRLVASCPTTTADYTVTKAIAAKKPVDISFTRHPFTTLHRQTSNLIHTRILTEKQELVAEIWSGQPLDYKHRTGTIISWIYLSNFNLACPFTLFS